MQLDTKGSAGKLAKWPGGLGQWGRHCKAQSSLDHLFPPQLLRTLVSWGVLALQDYLLATQAWQVCCGKTLSPNSSPRLSGGQLHRSRVKHEPPPPIQPQPPLHSRIQASRHIHIHQAMCPREP